MDGVPLSEQLLLAQAAHQTGAAPPAWDTVSTLLRAHPLIRAAPRADAAAQDGAAPDARYAARSCETMWREMMREQDIVDAAGAPRMDRAAQLALAQSLYAARLTELQDAIADKERLFRELHGRMCGLEAGDSGDRTAQPPPPATTPPPAPLGQERTPQRPLSDDDKDDDERVEQDLLGALEGVAGAPERVPGTPGASPPANGGAESDGSAEETAGARGDGAGSGEEAGASGDEAGPRRDEAGATGAEHAAAPSDAHTEKRIAGTHAATATYSSARTRRRAAADAARAKSAARDETPGATDGPVDTPEPPTDTPEPPTDTPEPPAADTDTEVAFDAERDKTRRRTMQLLLMVHSQVSNHTHGNLFHQAIKEADAPDYYELVKQPVDLKLIKQRIKEGSISSAIELRRALSLMFANALMYNQPGTEVYRMANEMRMATNEILDQLEKMV
ncbi:hypothetical protein MSPP1_003009 [Malassezia sp. CBS 17886]|nr:hypothetical protein MSPP1_003009 [Malassezia sp. CBS 17886]